MPSYVVYCYNCGTPICTYCEDHEVVTLPSGDKYLCQECSTCVEE